MTAERLAPSARATPIMRCRIERTGTPSIETTSVPGTSEASAEKFFVTIIGSTHGSAFGGASDPPSLAVERTTLDFLDAFVKGKRAGVARLQTDGSVPGVATLQAAP